MNLTAQEYDAVLAGLRLLQCGLDKRKGYAPVEPNDGDIGDILTNSGARSGLTAEEIDALCERVNT